MSQASRKLILALLSLVIITVFFSIDIYRDWLQKKVMTPISDIGDQLSYMEPQERMTLRLGSSYFVSKNIADYLKRNKLEKSAVVLLPPKQYIKEKNADYLVPEPVVFYYYTGLTAKWVNSVGVEKANYAVVFENNNLQMRPVDRSQLDSILKVYRGYKINL